MFASPSLLTPPNHHILPGDAHQALEVELHLAEHLQLAVVRLVAPGGVRARVDDVVEV